MNFLELLFSETGHNPHCHDERHVQTISQTETSFIGNHDSRTLSNSGNQARDHVFQNNLICDLSPIKPPSEHRQQQLFDQNAFVRTQSDIGQKSDILQISAVRKSSERTPIYPSVENWLSETRKSPGMSHRNARDVEVSSPTTFATSTTDEGYTTDPCKNPSNSNSSSRWSSYLTKNQETPKATKYRPSFKSSPYTSFPYHIPQHNRHNLNKEQKLDSKYQSEMFHSTPFPNGSHQNKLVHVAPNSFTSNHYQTDFESGQNQAGRQSLTLLQTFPEDPFSKVAPLSVRDYDENVEKHTKIISTNQRNLKNTSVYFGGSEMTKPTPRKVTRLSTRIPQLFSANHMTSKGYI